MPERPGRGDVLAFPSPVPPCAGLGAPVGSGELVVCLRLLHAARHSCDSLSDLCVGIGRACRRDYIHHAFKPQRTFKSVCDVLKTPSVKSLSISDDILNKFGVRGAPECQRVTSNGSRTMVLSGLISAIRPGFAMWPGWGGVGIFASCSRD